MTDFDDDDELVELKYVLSLYVDSMTPDIMNTDSHTDATNNLLPEASEAEHRNASIAHRWHSLSSEPPQARQLKEGPTMEDDFDIRDYFVNESTLYNDSMAPSRFVICRSWRDVEYELPTSPNVGTWFNMSLGHLQVVWSSNSDDEKWVAIKVRSIILHDGDPRHPGAVRVLHLDRNYMDCHITLVDNMVTPRECNFAHALQCARGYINRNLKGHLQMLCKIDEEVQGRHKVMKFAAAGGWLTDSLRGVVALEQSLVQNSGYLPPGTVHRTTCSTRGPVFRLSFYNHPGWHQHMV